MITTHLHLGGGTDHDRKAHLVNWHTLTRPKQVGSLGLRNLYVMNSACLMKFGWANRCGSNNLCTQVLRGKYSNRGIEQGGLTIKITNSAFWKAMVRIWPYITQHQFWVVGDGSRINA